ncbi:molybdopterin molybdotransferase [Desulfohalotomaculum tongense]|uniref:molybdopterin molybdotransferase MoeA n=1 Tax=Desulforadius tongensis TaxID=1216062 RepID=UPI0019568919|nr:gephyrin-like molybdotransferase Glp [Desulforadius tongensis]MBM7855340.1 molybdopterin molybdotransferase [Desulforadius tongensis]
MDLFNVLTVAESRELLNKNIRQKPFEVVPLLSSLGRVLAVDITAREDVPGFHRSTMDGYAVKARDTFGASESLPAYLDVVGQVHMGKTPGGELIEGQAWAIPTGGMLPAGADAVVMVEYTEELDERTIGVTRPVAPGENMVRRGEDVPAGGVVLTAGHRIRPQDLGILSAIGVTEVPVMPQVAVGIISTGDEVVNPETVPGPGQVRDINSYTLYGLVQQGGGIPKLYGVVEDNFNSLKETISAAINENDIVLVSGGSSVGVRDVSAKVINELGRPGVLFHGINIKPGKPTIGAVVDGKPVFGLPGHPVSAIVVYNLLVDPLVRWGSYSHTSKEVFVRARVTRNMRSAAGREDFLRVRLYVRQGELYAEPVLGKSGLISTMVKADGIARIPEGKEGVEAGEYLEVKLF